METILQVIGFLLIIFLFVFLIYHQVRLIYFRYICSYKDEIQKYLNPKGFKLVDTFYPRREDWEHSPYKKPPIFTITLGCLPHGFTKTEYLVIIAKTTSEKYREFWLEITTTQFCKPVLNFRQGNNTKNYIFEEEVTFN